MILFLCALILSLTNTYRASYCLDQFNSVRSALPRVSTQVLMHKGRLLRDWPMKRGAPQSGETEMMSPATRGDWRPHACSVLGLAPRRKFIQSRVSRRRSVNVDGRSSSSPRYVIPTTPTVSFGPGGLGACVYVPRTLMFVYVCAVSQYSILDDHAREVCAVLDLCLATASFLSGLKPSLKAVHQPRHGGPGHWTTDRGCETPGPVRNIVASGPTTAPQGAALVWCLFSRPRLCQGHN